MLTKAQKIEAVAAAKDLIKKSSNILLVEFSKVQTGAINDLKNDLKKINAKFLVVKKTLFSIAMKESGIVADLGKSDANLAVIFNPEDVPTIAGMVYKFGQKATKEKKTFSVKFVYDLKNKEMITKDQFIVIAKLPSREVLLAQLVGMIGAPIRSLMMVLKAKAEKPTV